MPVRASVLIAGDAVVREGDYLMPAGAGTNRPFEGGGHSIESMPIEVFARVIDPTPGEKGQDGSYRVRCEMLMRRRFIPATEKFHG